MTRKTMTRAGYMALLVCLALGLVGVAWAATDNIDPAGNVSPDDKWAWGTNVGWINFAPTHGGVSVYADHLEGYAWGENIGWIRMGTHAGGGTHTYLNTAAGNYGVNNDGSGNLSGYAWGTNVGWISFAPANGGVTIDMNNGEFEGYAWGENFGWIHLKGTAADTTEYKVAVRMYRIYLPVVLR